MSSVAVATRPADLRMFETEHLIVLASMVVSALVLTLIARLSRGTRHEHTTRLAISYGLVGVLLGTFIIAQAHRIITGTWSVRDALPLHLCDIGIFVTAAALWGTAHRRGVSVPAAAPADRGTRTDADSTQPSDAGMPRTPAKLRPPPVDIWQRLCELAYFWGVGGTLQSLITPDVVGRFPDATCLRYFFHHAGIEVAVLVLILGYGRRPRPGAVVRTWIVTFVLALLVLPINGLLNANYMYLCGPPKNPTLYDLFGPWPWALITLVVVGTLIFTVLYLPFWISDLIRGKRSVASDFRV